VIECNSAGKPNEPAVLDVECAQRCESGEVAVEFVARAVMFEAFAATDRTAGS